jgi:nicotinate dehydrogenase subunit B
VSLTAPVYSQSTIERGRVLAALGDCAVCHTAPGGAPNAGGRAMDTPFGTLYTTNLTPDADTGLGRWSFSAFQRAMREGVSRDGHHLYPAFPYTAFAKTSDDDLQALYAYFMSMPAVRAETPKSELKFPFSMRPLMAGWNALFHDPAPTAARGHAKRRVEPRRVPRQRPGPLRRLPHAAQCAGRGAGRQRLPIGRDGRWLGSARAHAPVEVGRAVGRRRALPLPAQRPHARHGIAGGPMAEVVRELAQVPDADVRAMATYLGSFNPAPAVEPQALAQQAIATPQARKANCSAPRSACSTAPAPRATTTATAPRCWA